MTRTTRQAHADLSDSIVDYLYDELDADGRAAFEREMNEDAELAAEVASVEATRGAFGRLPELAPPAGLMSAVMAEARAVAAQAVEVAPTRSLWVRLFERLTQPAFATALLAVVVLGVGVLMLNDGGPLDSARDAQRLPASFERARGPATASAPSATPQIGREGAGERRASEAPAGAPPTEDRDRRLTAALVGASSIGGGAGVDDESRRRDSATSVALGDEVSVADAPSTGGVVTVKEARAPSKPTNHKRDKRKGKVERKPRAARSSKVRDEESLLDRRGPRGADASKSPTSSKKAVRARVMTTGAPALGGAPSVRRGGAELPQTATEQHEDDLAPPRSASRSAPAQRRPLPEVSIAVPGDAGERYTAPASEPVEVAEREDADKGAEHLTENKADEGAAGSPERREAAALWERYQRYLDAERWSDADEVLTLLVKLPGQAERVRTARAKLAKRREASGAGHAEKQGQTKRQEIDKAGTTERTGY